jgi:hypothetical protein
VRDQIKNFASSGGFYSKGFKLIILDEADAMTSDAQFALRRGIAILFCVFPALCLLISLYPQLCLTPPFSFPLSSFF